MSFLIVLGVAAVVYFALRPRSLSERFPREKHDMIRFPDGGMTHDPDCRQVGCDRRRAKR